MIDISPYTTLHTPTNASELLEIVSEDQLKNEIAKGTFLKPYYLLGCGANVLFTKNFPGTIVLNQIRWDHQLKNAGDEVFITVSSGKTWHETVMFSVNQNLSGMENMALIPGTVGAAAVGNIAAYGQNQEDIFDHLTAINLTTGVTENFSKTDLLFSYRESIFKNKLIGKYFITSITYRLSKVAHLELSYHATRHASLLPQLEKIAKEPFTIKDVAQAVIDLRTAKLPDWTVVNTAGSFFKNPIIHSSSVSHLRSIIPDLQTYPAEKLSYLNSNQISDYVKVPAGMLLDELGWKGKKIGRVSTSPNHALVIITDTGTTGEEIYEFSERMRSDVKSHFDIDLEYEVVIV